MEMRVKTRGPKDLFYLSEAAKKKKKALIAKSKEYIEGAYCEKQRIYRRLNAEYCGLHGARRIYRRRSMAHVAVP